MKTLSYPRYYATEEKECQVNPNCPVRILLDYIRSVVLADGEHDIPQGCDLDLCDEGSMLKNLNDSPPWTNFYETGVLVPRSIYYVVLLERDEEGGVKPSLLLTKNTRLYTEMITKIRRQLQPQSKQKRGEKGRMAAGKRSVIGLPTRY